MARDVICEKKMREKDVVGIVTFDLIGLLPTNIITLLLILQRHIGVCEETFNVNSNYQIQIFEISLSESRIYKKWQTSVIIREIIRL